MSCASIGGGQTSVRVCVLINVFTSGESSEYRDVCEHDVYIANLIGALRQTGYHKLTYIILKCYICK